MLEVDDGQDNMLEGQIVEKSVEIPVSPQQFKHCSIIFSFQNCINYRRQEMNGKSVGSSLFISRPY